MIAAALDTDLVWSVPRCASVFTLVLTLAIHCCFCAYPTEGGSSGTPQSPEPGPTESPSAPGPAQWPLLNARLWDEWDRVPPPPPRSCSL